jgi:hypothetical protein
MITIHLVTFHITFHVFVPGQTFSIIKEKLFEVEMSKPTCHPWRSDFVNIEFNPTIIRVIQAVVKLRNMDQAAWSKDLTYLIDEEVLILDLIQEGIRSTADKY